MRKHSRRRFLTTAGAAASVAIFGPSFFDSSTVLAAPGVRRDLGGLAATDPIITGYQTAVTAMKGLSANDPRSWSYQAAIHGTYTMPDKVAWNTCEHGTYFFWSWHRMYLYYFERIVRKYSGVSGWMLPYWNYGSASQRHLPAVFRDSATSLFVANPNRPTVWNNGSASLSAARVDTTSGMAQLNFTNASSGLENSPHNHVHVDISGWMGDPATAAQDPVFYVHHANIDRLWNLWKAQGGGRIDPLSDSAWKNTLFTFFDENKKQVKMKGCDVLRAADQLNYTYEGEPAQVNEYCLRFILPPWIFQKIELIRWPGPPVELGPDRVSIPLDIKAVRQRLTRMVQDENQTVTLELRNVVAEKLPGVVWEVYLGLPPNTEPDPEGPYYVGAISLFAAGVRSKAHRVFKPAEFSLTLDKALPNLLRSNRDKLDVTFVPSGPLIDGKPSRPKVQAKVRIGSLSVSVEQRTKGRQ
jgi:hypothetical protein